MFSHPKKIIFTSIIFITLLTSLFFLISAFLNIQQAYAKVLIAKGLSLFFLAVFESNDPLVEFLTKLKKEYGKTIHFFVVKFGSILCIIFSAVVFYKAKLIESGENIIFFKDTIIVKYQLINEIIIYLLNIVSSFILYSEFTTLIPLIYFALVNVILSSFNKSSKNTAKIFFYISDFPVIMSIICSIIFAHIICNSKNDYNLLISGSTIMLVYISIILSECAKEV